MHNQSLAMTNLARLAHNQRLLALKQQDSSIMSAFPLGKDDDSHLDLTAGIRFLEACGGPPPFVLERVDESGNVDHYGFERPFLLVGRSAACDVACRTRTVSFRHLYLHYLQGVVWWFDLDSRSGTLCGGQKKRAGCLLPGMTITVGEHSLRLIESPSSVSSSQAAAAPKTQAISLRTGQQAEVPSVFLEFQNGKIGEGEQRWPVENTITLLGRRSCCDIRFADETVSRVHSSLILTPEGLWIVDLLGREGTWVNGQQSAYAYLQDGSEFKIGGYRVTVRYGETAAAPHPAEAVLEEDQRANWKSQSPGQAGSVSEDLLYSLVTNMAQMQKQMFDQSQQQIGLLVQMLGSFHLNQQDILREELSRVHDISREMQDLQRRLLLQQNEGTPAPSPSALPREANLRLETPPARKPNGAAPRLPIAEEEEDQLPEPSLLPRDEDEPRAKPALKPEGEEDRPRPKSNEVQDHGVLFQRMQVLDRERNGRLQRIFRALSGSS